MKEAIIRLCEALEEHNRRECLRDEAYDRRERLKETEAANKNKTPERARRVTGVERPNGSGEDSHDA